MDDQTRARALSALERYRDGPPAHARSYPDLHEHVHEENNILFPRALALAA